MKIFTSQSLILFRFSSMANAAKFKFSAGNKPIVLNKSVKLHRVIFGTLLFCLLATTLSAYAGPLEDKVDQIKTKVNSIKKDTGGIQYKLNTLPERVQARMKIDLGGIKQSAMDAIGEIKGVITEQKDRLDAFGDGSPGDGCYNFRESMKNLMDDLKSITTQLKSIGRADFNDAELEELALWDSVPCKLLLGPNIAFEQTPIEELTEKLGQAADALDILIPMFISGESQGLFNQKNAAQFQIDLQNSSKYELATMEDTELIHTEYCKVISRPASRALITGAASTLTSIAVLLEIVAAKIDTETFNGISELRKLTPIISEAEGGVWGFASVSIKREKGAHKIANGLKFVSKVFFAVSDSAASSKRHCINTHNAQVVFDSNQAIMKSNQDLMKEVCTMTRFRSQACKDTLL
jgi:hypothetical protein